jgi:hypothetical protein
MVKNSLGMHGSKGEQRHAHAWRTRVPIDSPRRSRWCVVQNLVWSSPADALLPCHGSSVLFRFKTYYMGTYVQYCSASWQTWKGTSRRLKPPPAPHFFY